MPNFDESRSSARAVNENGLISTVLATRVGFVSTGGPPPD
jgi:hypothetical protein